MRKFLLASVAALGFAGTASAADLAVAPVVYAPAFTWTGCYLGINGGWIGSDESYTSNFDVIGGPRDPAEAASIVESRNSYGPNDSGGTAGGQFGCQTQLGSWVIGGEWDWNWSGLKEDNTYVDLFPNQFNQDWYQYTHKELDWFSTARVKLGFAWDRFMIYATGGLAYGSFDANTHLDFADFVPPLFFGGYHEKRFGWTAGGGLEWAFANNWTAKAEYLYLDFGSFDYVSVIDLNQVNDPAFVWRTDVDAKEHVIRVGINYLFHTGGAPLVARY